MGGAVIPESMIMVQSWWLMARTLAELAIMTIMKKMQLCTLEISYYLINSISSR